MEMVINAAESGDPDSPPSIWDLARQHHIHPQLVKPVEPLYRRPTTTSFVVSWHPVDAEREVTQATTDADVELQKSLVERGSRVHWPNTIRKPWLGGRSAREVRRGIGRTNFASRSAASIACSWSVQKSLRLDGRFQIARIAAPIR